jgi:lipopolysaccharide O-acetyltransferase
VSERSAFDAVRRRMSRLRRDTRLAVATYRDTWPPPREAFAAFGEDSWIVPPARVTEPEHIEIGARVVVHEHAWISVASAVPSVTPRLVIGDRTKIGRFAHFACVGEIVIEEDVLTADGIFIGDTYHGYEDPTTPVSRQPMAKPEPVLIKLGAFLGIRSIVLQGVTIGENAYVGAGAVVTEDVPDRTIVVGNPARPVRQWDDAANDWIRSRPTG